MLEFMAKLYRSFSMLSLLQAATSARFIVDKVPRSCCFGLNTAATNRFVAL